MDATRRDRLHEETHWYRVTSRPRTVTARVTKACDLTCQRISDLHNLRTRANSISLPNSFLRTREFECTGTARHILNRSAIADKSITPIRSGVKQALDHPWRVLPSPIARYNPTDRTSDPWSRLSGVRHIGRTVHQELVPGTGASSVTRNFILHFALPLYYIDIPIKKITTAPAAQMLTHSDPDNDFCVGMCRAGGICQL